jgi:Calx-beta domain
MKTKTWIILGLLAMSLNLNLSAQTPVAPALVPANGTFFLLSEAGTNGMSGPPWPFNPYTGWSGVEIYSLGGSDYAVDDRQVAAAKTALTQESGGSMETDDEGPPPLPGGGTNDDGTNSGGGGFQSFDDSYKTNGSLWISISNDPNNAYVTAYNTTNAWNYQLLYKTNLSVPGGWTLGQVKSGDYTTNLMAFDPVPVGDDLMRFFQVQQAGPEAEVEVAQQDAIEPDAAEGDPGQPGIFVLAYSAYNAQITNNVTVYYQLTGTASNGVDYDYLNGVATIPVSPGYVEVDVNPIEDDVPEPDETVILTLLPDTNYLINPAEASGTVYVKDSSTTLSIYNNSGRGAVEPDGPPGAPAVTNVFTIDRTDERGSNGTLTVSYQVSGTASNGVDYQFLSGTLTIPAGASSADLDIVPLEDDLPEGVETVTVTLLPTNGYEVDTNNDASATTTITDSSTTVSILSGNNVVEPGPDTNSPGQTGSFTVSRDDTRNIFTNLTVYYSIFSTASNGVDYGPLSGQISFAPGDTSTNIYVPPLTNNQLVGDAPLTLTLIFDPAHPGDYLLNTNNLSAAILVEGTVPTNLFAVVTNLSAEPVGIDYDPILTNIIVSTEDGYPDFQGDDFVRLGTNNTGGLTLTNWSSVQGLEDEVKLVTVKTNQNGFVAGDVYFSSNDGVGWLSADGTRSNLTWCVLTNDVVTNNMLIRGGFYIDPTGLFSNDLVVASSDASYNSSVPKGVWLVNANGQPRLLAQILTSHLEGVIVLPNDTNQWGPWAGKILTGDERENILYTIDTNGVVTPYNTQNLFPDGIGSEDFDLIPTNQDLYCSVESPSFQLQKISRTFWTPYAGDLLITESGDGPSFPIPGSLFIVRWDNMATNFTIRAISPSHSEGFEHVTFAPINLPTQ